VVVVAMDKNIESTIRNAIGEMGINVSLRNIKEFI
jgi:hypothetical protein